MYKPTRGGKPPFRGGKKFGGDRERGAPMLYDAVCAECRSKCQVPFRPNGKKPVLCRDCFGGNDRDTSPRKPALRSIVSRPTSVPSADTALLREINAKLDAILTALHA